MLKSDLRPEDIENWPFFDNPRVHIKVAKNSKAAPYVVERAPGVADPVTGKKPRYVDIYHGRIVGRRFMALEEYKRLYKQDGEPRTAAPRLFAGVMSGTSLDGADAVVCRFFPAGAAEKPARIFEAVGRGHAPFSAALRRELLAFASGAAERTPPTDPALAGCDVIDRLGAAAAELARCYALAVERAAKDAGVKVAEIEAAGIHGQTIRHRPKRGFTLQLNDPALAAELLGIDVAADFRSRDVAAGGEGAPLVPPFHALVCAGSPEPAAILNIGGIANATLIPGKATASAEESAEKDADADAFKGVFGFDTGPGNMLLDAWMDAALGEPFDRDGRTAASGRIIEPFLEQLLAEPYFALPPPKSTGRERFSAAWLREQLDAAGVLPLSGAPSSLPADVKADVAATLTAFTARTAAAAIAKAAPATKRVYACGGGALNPTLLAALEAALRRESLALEDFGTTEKIGVAPMDMEAAAFAWLAMALLDGRAANLPSATRAAGPRILGALWPGKPRPLR